MESALIIAGTEKSVTYFTQILRADACAEIVALPSGAEARRLLLERDFDVVIINAPLQDEPGEALSRHIASKGASQVILIVKTAFVDEISAATENDGVLVVAKPINSSLLWAALKLAKSAQNRLKRMQAENVKLKQRIEDIRIIDRAKCVLISHLNINEQEAHRLIEKQAMDMRMTRREIAQEVLKAYEP